MEPEVPLVIPAVNPEALEGWPKPGIISVPNCTTITAMLAVAPLHRAAGCTSLVLSSYQAVSGAGHKAIAELLEQVEKLRGDEEALAHPDVPTLPVGPVMGRTIAYNVIPRIGAFQADGYTGEEAKMMAESRKILSAPDLPVVATSVRVPVLVGHAVSILAEFARPIAADEARDLLRSGARGRGLGRPGRRRLPHVDRRGRRRCGARGQDPSGAGARRCAGPVQLRRQPPCGRRPRRRPDRRAPV